MKQENLEYLNRVVTGIQKVTQMVREDTRDAVATGDHVEIIRHYDQVRKAMDLIKEAREALEGMKDMLSKDQVPEAMRAAGVKTITVEGVGRVTISHRYSVSMIDKIVGHRWLEDHDMGDIIIPTVNAQTLSSSIREWGEAKGEEPPTDIFKVSTSAYTSITKK